MKKAIRLTQVKELDFALDRGFIPAQGKEFPYSTSKEAMKMAPTNNCILSGRGRGKRGFQDNEYTGALE